MSRPIAGVLLGIASFGWWTVAVAEPWFAIDTGHRCQACHVNPSGGGKRTAYGNAFAQLVLAQHTLGEFWDGRINRRLRIGGDLRGNLATTRIPGQEDSLQFDFEEALVYVELRLLDEDLLLYLDERIAPGGATNRESYLLYRFREREFYVKAGRMFLPYGWRLEDDTEFIRQVPGINYATPDDGIEVGWETRRTSVQLALTNGTAGAGEVDRGKQFNLRGEYLRPRWRAGGSLNINDTDSGDRRMQNLFAGWRTGPVNWLAEADYIVDETFAGGERKQWIVFGEANIGIRPGHNLKLSFGWFDPDDALDEDERNRWSAVWEYFPIPFTQVSVGLRSADGIPQAPLQNADEFFVQLHGFF